MVFHGSLIDSTSPQVSRTLLSILADLNNAVVWMVSTRALISESSGPCKNLLWLHRVHQLQLVSPSLSRSIVFFNSQARSTHLSLSSILFSFTLWLAGTTKSNIRQVFLLLLLLLLLLTITRSGLLAEIR